MQTVVISILVIPFNTRALFQFNYYYNYFTSYTIGLKVRNYYDRLLLGIAIKPDNVNYASFNFFDNKDIILNSGQHFNINTLDT
jgi:hypothetical protein